MNDKPKVYIAGVGMLTPVGANAEMTTAAITAGISAYQETEYFDKNYNKIKMAIVPDEVLDDCLEENLIKGELSAKQARMLQLSKIALMQILPIIPENIGIPLFFAGPEQLGIKDQGLSNLFLENLLLQTEVKVDLSASRILSTGRAGSINVIQLAFRYFETGNHDFVLVGGVDTFYDKSVLDYLDDKDRLLCDEVLDGFIPGEGAGFILLTKNKHPHSEYDSYVYEPGMGVEDGHMFSENTYTGDGLSKAFATAIANSKIGKIKCIYSSLNGESHFAKEYGVALTRNNTDLDDMVSVEHPADCIGDLGAATGVVLTGIIATRIKNGKNITPSIVYCSSDREQRAAAVIHN